MTEMETTLAGVSQHPWDVEEESRMIRYFAFDFSTGETDGGDCADMAWETQYVAVPVLDRDDMYVRYGELSVDVVEHLCERLHGEATLASAICLVRA